MMRDAGCEMQETGDGRQKTNKKIDGVSPEPYTALSRIKWGQTLIN
jgi:hypothetical protein